MQKLVPYLMFVGDQFGNAEQAVQFYTSLFEDSSIESIERWREGEPGGEVGLIKLAKFTLSGQSYLASENNFPHGFTFTPAISIYVECIDEAEITRLCAEMGESGAELMPLDNYGFSKLFAWVADRFGVSWQLNLAS